MNALFSRSSWVAALVLAALFGGFCFHEAASIAFPHVNLDEQGHVSYAMHLKQSKVFFPPLTQMRLYDFAQLRWSGEPNFINHPALGYHLLNLFTDFDPLGANVRTGSISLFVFGFAAILFGLHLTGLFSNLGLAAVTMVCVLLKLQRFGETFSNDSVAFLGGGLAFLGTVLLLNRPRPAHAALVLGALGMALCLAAKLNAALLVGAFVMAILTFHALGNRQNFRSLSKPLLALLVAICLAAAFPFVQFVQEFGTPAPNTPGQIKMLLEGAEAERLSFSAYLFQSLKGALENAGSDATITYGLFAVVTGIGAVVIAMWQGALDSTFPLRPIARAAIIATVLTLALHLSFSFQRHVQYGWQPELYPRYYFPLLGPYLLLFFCTVSRWGPLRAFAPRPAD
jgi:hypothetical protein